MNQKYIQSHNQQRMMNDRQFGDRVIGIGSAIGMGLILIGYLFCSYQENHKPKYDSHSSDFTNRLERVIK